MELKAVYITTKFLQCLKESKSDPYVYTYKYVCVYPSTWILMNEQYKTQMKTTILNTEFMKQNGQFY